LKFEYAIRRAVLGEKPSIARICFAGQFSSQVTDELLEAGVATVMLAEIQRYQRR
jgi:hypothetical protein